MLVVDPWQWFFVSWCLAPAQGRHLGYTYAGAVPTSYAGPSRFSRIMSQHHSHNIKRGSRGLDRQFGSPCPLFPPTFCRTLCLSRREETRSQQCPAGRVLEDLCLSPFGAVLLNLLHVFPTSISFDAMAMTMADNVIRKACDRCHTQKLSCKRVGDEPCERCVRLKTECKSSPSLRYKKQQLQHHQQQQQQQHLQQYHQPPTPHQNQHQHHLHLHQPQHQHQPAQQPSNPSAETVQIRSRSPKRRRTDSDPSLVLPEAGRCPHQPLWSCLVMVDHRLTILPKQFQ